ncbi:hypothetical protein JTB14_024056 [Gonioctena quinquepunctata]|nr:hypothetical protein JTB14_024056 [Gonioctena quinquepunctata]
MEGFLNHSTPLRTLPFENLWKLAICVPRSLEPIIEYAHPRCKGVGPLRTKLYYWNLDLKNPKGLGVLFTSWILSTGWILFTGWILIPCWLLSRAGACHVLVLFTAGFFLRADSFYGLMVLWLEILEPRR